MNQIFLMGRLTNEPNLNYSSKDPSMAITKYTLAVDSGYGDNKRTDFIRCVTFGKSAEFANKYFNKGQRVLVQGRLQISKYKNKDGQEVYSTDVVIEAQEFADSKKENIENPVADAQQDDELPFT